MVQRPTGNGVMWIVRPSTELCRALRRFKTPCHLPMTAFRGPIIACFLPKNVISFTKLQNTFTFFFC
jgi:hypothetical protein